MKSFAQLFKKYRLRAEFETFSSFGDALAEKGYFYEESIFSHWQKGTRIPNKRDLVLCIIKIFIEKNALQSLSEANQMLESVGQGYVTEKEREELNLHELASAPFQVPYEIAYFTGREAILKKIQREIGYGKVFLLHGTAGVGKTALAIKLGHLLRDKFPDGVLWYKVDSSNEMDILLSIARVFGEDISGIKDIEVRASIVRTLLSKKRLLLIFDNITKRDRLYLLLPDISTCSIIFTSRENFLNTLTHHISVALDSFTENEVLLLFTKVFTKRHVATNKRIILQIAKKIGNLPLAVHIIAAQSKQFNFSFEEYLTQLQERDLDLESLTYEDKNLSRTITIGFSTLDAKTKEVFVSLCVFEGKDFSLEAVAFINKISLDSTKYCLRQLLDISFIEESSNKRYRIHPLMKVFVRKKNTDQSVYLHAAFYYERILNIAEDKQSYKILTQEVDNIIYIFKKCYEFGYWDQIITLWNPIEKFLSDTNEVKKLRSLIETIDTAPSISKFQNFLYFYAVVFLIYVIVMSFTGLTTSGWNYLSNFLIGLPPFIGGFFGVIRSKPWGLFNNNIGKAIFFISAGLFCWGSGNMIWAYYDYFQNVSVPYPSWADAGYTSAGILWIIGIIFLSRATGTKFSLHQKLSKLFFLIIPVIILAFSCYFLLFVIKRNFTSDAPLKMFFDLIYPSMDIVILTNAIIIFGLSVNVFRGKYKRSLFAILAGFVCMYIADFTFSYTTSLGLYYNGSFFDIPFGLAQFLLTWGTLSFYLTPRKK